LIVTTVAMGLAIPCVQAATYPDVPVAAPVSNPGFPPSFKAFDPPVDTNMTVSLNVPAIAEWTRSNDPTDTMVLTGSRLSSFTGNSEGRDTRFVLFGQSAIGKAEADGSIQRLDGMQAAITLPSALPTGEMYLLWPRNSNGFGKPVAINQTEAWWIGLDTVSRNEGFSVYGRNLVLGAGACHLYIEGYGWITSTTANPYKADFVVPANLPNGTHTVYAHNGHGRGYGWSKALTLTITDATDWAAGKTINVANYGANGADTGDDLAAITSAIAAASGGDTIYFPAGTYYVSDRIQFGGGKRIMGAGMDLTTIEAGPGFELQPRYRYLVGGNISGTEIHDLTISCGRYLAQDSRTVEIRNSSNVLFENVRVDQRDIPNPYQIAYVASVDAENTRYLTFRNCDFIMGRNLSIGSSKQVVIDGCDFYGIYDNNALVYANHANQVGVYNSTAQPYDNSDTTDGFGWSKGRWITGSHPNNLYFGNNNTHEMCPRYDSNYGKYNQPVDQNSGEQIMFEGLYTKYRGQAIASTANTVGFADLSSNYSGFTISVVGGTGLGQSRKITSFSAGTVTVDEPWQVQPDTSSVLSIGYYGHRVVVYGNTLDGDPRTTDPHAYLYGSGPSYTNYTATAGVSAYGGFHDLVVANNTIQQVATALYNWSLAEEPVKGVSGYALWQPNYFNLFVDNQIDECLYGLANNTSDFTGKTIPYYDTAMFGTVWRRNNLNNITGRAFSSGVSAAANIVEMQVFDKNVATAIRGSVSIADRISNQVWIGNNISAGYGGTALSYSSNYAPVLRGNTWTGFNQTYSVSNPDPILEAPVRNIVLNSTDNSKQVQIFNSGQSSLGWSATTTAPWVNLTQATGVVSGENASGALGVELVGSVLPSADSEAVIDVSGGGQVMQLTVKYEAASATPPPPDGPPAPVLTGLAVSGPSNVVEGGSIQLICTASFSDGTTANVVPTWSEGSIDASISGSGLLVAGDVAVDTDVTVTASLAGVTATYMVTINFIPVTLTGITISGAASLDEETAAQYTCTANYSDGSTQVVVPSWSENSTFASIATGGLLSAGDVLSDQNVTISASFNGMTDTQVVTIMYVPPVITALTVSGPSTVNEQTSAQYICIANYSDGTSQVVVPGWSESSPFATISGSGAFNAGDVASDQTVTISAYLDGRSDTHTVLLKYVPPTVTGLQISGPAKVGENNTAQYVCTATLFRWNVTGCYADLG